MRDDARRPDEETIDDLAEAIAAGRPVNEETLGDLGSGTSSVVANLIALSKLSDLHRVPDARRLSGAAADPAVEIWGDLRLLEKLGEGSFGEVYRAWDSRLHRLVALKLARAAGGDRAAENSLEEGRLLAKVDHPNVVRIHGGAEHDGRAGLWMELVEGTTLSGAVETGGIFAQEEVARIGADLSDALQAIHDAGLVHGDVKAQNVIRDPGGRVVLMDFGAGSRASVPDDPAGRAGTPMYTPPEIFAGEKPSPRSDLFSLGVLLFGLLTGRFPVEADSLKEVIAAHVEGRRARLLDLRPEVPAGLARAVERAMAPTPDDRFRTAREMGDALRRWAPAPADATPAAETAAVPAPAAALRSPRILPWTIALAVLAVIVVMLVRTPAPTALIAEAELLRGTDPAEQLISGDVVQAGDLLHLRLDVAHESWIYVLNRDDRGSLSLLFPLPGYVLQNPVSPGGAVAIPGAPAGSRTNMAWEMGGGGGTERFLVVAARKPLEDFEAELRRLPLPGEGATARALDESAAAGLYRGVADMAQLPEPAAPDGGAGRALFDLARSLDASGDGDVWVREIALRSP